MGIIQTDKAFVLRPYSTPVLGEDVRPGYTFEGWNTSADGSGTAVAGGSAYRPPNDITLYAQWKWKENDVSVTVYSYNSGYSSTFVESDGARMRMAAAQDKTTGYDLSNSRRWVVQHGDEPREVLRVENATGVILWEKYYRVSYETNWDMTEREVVFDTDGGTPCDPRTAVIGQPVGELPETYMPKPEGYAGMEFNGWWTAAQGGERVTPETIVPEGTEPFTVYAHWLGVLHYENIGGITIDADGVASGFRQSSTQPNLNKYLRIVSDDKFDFSGNFDIVFKCSDIPSAGPERRDVFAGIDVDGSSDENTRMDLGMAFFGASGADINGHYCCWEIADPDNYDDISKLIGSKLSGPSNLPGPVWLCAARRDNTVKCYVKTDGDSDKRLDKDGTGKRVGNFKPGVFAIGADLVSTNEYFPGKIHLNECYLQLYTTTSPQRVGTYVLRPATQ